MPLANVIGHIGGGLYRVTIDREIGFMDDRLAAIQQAITDLNAEKTELQKKIAKKKQRIKDIQDYIQIIINAMEEGKDL